ncbi:hypothetical protein [Paraprevotella xylaniphila]|uniref:hypothetical protein n=1 Tax=Paraprevotella xylaniphila TaxID=454155 RepID=UPI001032BADB|nr:hypothetical protein [Paraprevotella xylaniphila]
MNRFFKVFWPWLMVPVFWLVVGLSLFAVCGCARVQYVPVETVRIDSVHGARWSVDSVYLKDSIHVELRTERDTVYRTEYKYRTHWRERVVRDTLVSVRTDSVGVPYPVERKLSRWEETKLHYGGFALVAVVVCILIGFGRFVYRLKK